MNTLDIEPWNIPCLDCRLWTSFRSIINWEH